MNIARVLVANRGEIAIRVIKACRALGIESVAAFSQADRESLPARMADRAVCIGPARSAESYLKIESIISAALGTRSDAIHPGYGFLAEDPELAEACAKHGLKFIGPRPENIRQMGNKLFARAVVGEYGIPVVPGSKKVKNLREACGLAEEIGFPLLFKAAAGGGGRGIKIVTEPNDLRQAFETAAAEARAAFGDGTLYLERYIPNARHIEVQVLGDRSGNVVHIGERDCSLQRRYQKVVEEAPAPPLSEALREKIRQAGATIAREMGYENAGTVEFIVDQDQQQFYFLEMNTRIQVEHPVTEMITGLDLVEQQIRIADGQPLSISQSDVRFTGHAIECRITAESANHGFRPCPGPITAWDPPVGPDIRVDTHCFAGYVVPPFYDSLLAKLITRGEDRREAAERMQNALASFAVGGVDTTIPFLRFLLAQPDYIAGTVNTRWLEAQLRHFPLCG
ncbi:MAG: acetyl-CoA carboxylase biotin carboxylase subunit [Deltaproteobacteria bacterium]|nr:acetyl-CoA carboxylase biotin carboxylase subunit [Deltaproteobacteria bacterium]